MNILDTIGHTPLVFLDAVSASLPAKIHIKYEARNPGGSVKDRAAAGYLRAALASGELASGGTVVEATSGNLGIGLAVACGKMGLTLMLAVPASASRERVALLRAMGAKVILTPAEQGMQGAQDKVEELLATLPGAFRPDQFSNPVGPRVHYESTGAEILEDCAKEGFSPSAFVAGVGSGATLIGVSRRLKEADPSIFCAAVEPAESPVLSQGRSGAHGIQGIGANFVPTVFDRSLVDDILTVSTEDAMETARMLMAKESLSCGITSGANVRAAMALALRPEFAGKHIVTIAPDTGERYLSTPLFSKD
ncbi:PLP-dependent cysteine synthase family protein [Mailhella massiliensis]|uniref:cysteine synthase n=1 Tax=Mailhella massiliensis TaxID=1903261 RepID=A0A921DQ31_9BACT|nr:cysteine synthase [Mailhella massiliensis]HJD96035.1 cysteine synthase [Mailhella massiliensis]